MDEIPIGIDSNKEIITLPMNKEKPIIVILGQRRMGMSVFNLTDRKEDWNNENGIN